MDEVNKRALENFEIFNKLRRGSASLNNVKSSSAGLEGWANWRATDNMSNQKSPPRILLASVSAALDLST